MNPTCAEIKNYIDDTLRADVYLALRWRWFTRYLSKYSEDVIKACLPYLGVELRGDTVFLWAGEYCRRLVEVLANFAREDASVIAELYSEEVS
jgi:hypothetical protein